MTTFTTGLIAQTLGGVLDGPPDIVVNDLAGLEVAGPTALSFIRSDKFAMQWATSKSPAALVTKGLIVPGHDPKKRALIFVENADLAMNRILDIVTPKPYNPDPGVHPTAVVDPSAKIPASAHVGAHCVIGPHTSIGEHTILHARVTLGAKVSIGSDSVLHPGVVIYDRCIIGDRTVLHAGAIIGADGFGYIADPKGGALIKIPHAGIVHIGNDVEIGANACIDRGKFGATSVGDGSKIDNLVQVGHNVRIGRAVIVCGMTGIAGSAVLEDGCIIAGHVGIADGHVIGKGATVSAKSAVMNDIPAGETWFGVPAGPHKEMMRSYVALRKLSDHLRTIKSIKKIADKLEGIHASSSGSDRSPLP